MADDAQTIRTLNWRELFPFINLFRAFRVAIHPSKLVLGFALLLFVYVGGRILDGIWPATFYANYDEIDQYTIHRWSHDPTASFEDKRDATRADNLNGYAGALLELNIVKDADPAKAMEKAREAAQHVDYRSKLQEHIVQKRNTANDDAKKTLIDTLNAIKGTEDERRTQEKRAREAYDQSIRANNATAIAKLQEFREHCPRPLFDAFFDYEVRQFHNALSNALTWNWLNGVMGAGAGGPPGVPQEGVLKSVANLTVVGPGWLVRYHLVYAIIFYVWFLLVWAVFGGAIARITAVHVARDEKISVRQALRFSTNKLLSFVFAPLIPLIIILVAGVIIAVGGLLLYIPVVGPIVVGAFLILALLAGFIITLVVTGMVGGLNLMYPTIAVEGSDSFDAISRSFSYVFARPWRMIFYTVVSLVYGALCFLFVRYFVYVMLSLTHFFVQWFLGGNSARYWPEIWPSVNDMDLAHRINYQGLAWSEAVGASLIAVWVYVVLTFLAAFVISFYFSSNTIIYYLMRREVDATELDDVYVEETEEDFAEPAPVAATTTTTPVATTETSPPATPT